MAQEMSPARGAYRDEAAMIAAVAGPGGMAFLLTCLCALVAWLAGSKETRLNLPLVALALVALAVAALVERVDPGRTLAVTCAAFLLAAALPRTPDTALVASRRTLTWLGIATTALLSSSVLDNLNRSQPTPGLVGPIGGLLVVGIAIMIGAFPFGFWLPSLAEESPGSTALLVGTLGLGAAILGVTVLGGSPWRVGNLATAPLLGMTGVAAALATLLAVGEKQPGRVFAYLISADAALQLGGFVGSPASGASNLLFSFSAHALAATVGLAVLAAGRLEFTGLFQRRPALAAALILSGGSLVGLPLTAGFTSRFDLTRALTVPAVFYAAFAALATVLGALALARAFGPVFERTGAARAPMSRFDLLVGFVSALIVLAGVVPSLFLSLAK